MSGERLEKRVVTFQFPDRDSAERFLRAVERSKAPGLDVMGQVKGNRLVLKIFGPHATAKDYTRQLVELKRTVVSEVEDEREVRLHLSTICKEAGAPKVPPDLLVEALRRKGYEARHKGPWITTDAPMSEIKELVKELAEAYREARVHAASEPVRKMMALACVEHGVDPFDLALEAVDRGILKEREDGKAALVKDPEETQQELMELAEELKSRRERGRTLADLLEPFGGGEG